MAAKTYAARIPVDALPGAAWAGWILTVTPRDTVRIQPAHAAPGSTAAGVRAAYVLATTLSAVAVAPARKNQPRRLPARTAINAPTSANESVIGMKPNTAVQATPPVRPSITFAASSTMVRASSVQARPFGSRFDMSPSRAPLTYAQGQVTRPAIRQRYGGRGLAGMMRS